MCRLSINEAGRGRDRVNDFRVKQRQSDMRGRDRDRMKNGGRDRDRVDEGGRNRDRMKGVSRCTHIE
jgi:hypothetical protein